MKQCQGYPVTASILSLQDSQGVHVGEFSVKNLDTPLDPDKRYPAYVENEHDQFCTLGWTNKNYQKFHQRLEAHGYEIEIYHGRFFYFGPAIICSCGERDRIARLTEINLQHDTMGLGIIVYPR